MHIHLIRKNSINHKFRSNCLGIRLGKCRISWVVDVRGNWLRLEGWREVVIWWEGVLILVVILRSRTNDNITNTMKNKMNNKITHTSLL